MCTLKPSFGLWCLGFGILSAFVGAFVLGIGYAAVRDENARYTNATCYVTDHRIDSYSGYQATCYVGYVTYTVPNYAQIEVKKSDYGCYKLTYIQNLLNQYPIGSSVSCFILPGSTLSIRFSLQDTQPSFIVGILFLSLSGCLFIVGISFYIFFNF